ncbi:MAG: glycosyltransferase family 2 protein, partial [Selenomonadaceae bacterium]|nr:glycosyltransferase family 2 protein [Selenomonadaceae bacterium]
LRQSFSDFELIIRDDCSTDGVFDFVRENFSDRRIKFLQNEKNRGEFITRDLLTKDAAGKYLTILHNDDLYLSDALEKLYAVAEKFGADVVHASSFLKSGDDGVIENGAPLHEFSYEPRPAKKIEILSDNSAFRFNQWFTGEIFRDDQYNLFRREFILDGEIFSKTIGWDSLIVSLGWIMKAKILVKTPQIFYIRRENPYSQTHWNTSAVLSSDEYGSEISRRIELFRGLEDLISGVEFFRENPVAQYKIKARAFGLYESLNFNDSAVYGNAEFAQTYATIERTFKKHFGADGVYLALMYHWAHAMHFGQSQIAARLKDSLKILERNI